MEHIDDKMDDGPAVCDKIDMDIFLRDTKRAYFLTGIIVGAGLVLAAGISFQCSHENYVPERREVKVLYVQDSGHKSPSTSYLHQ